MGHALRLLMTRGHQLGGTVEMGELYVGASPRRDADRPHLGRGRKGQPRTTKTLVWAVVQSPVHAREAATVADARAHVVTDLSERETRRVLSENVNMAAQVISDECKVLVSVGQAFAAHDTVRHSDRQYVRGAVHANSAEGFSDRVRRTLAAVFQHISPRHAYPYFHVIGLGHNARFVKRDLHAAQRSETRRKDRAPATELRAPVSQRCGCVRITDSPMTARSIPRRNGSRPLLGERRPRKWCREGVLTPVAPSRSAAPLDPQRFAPCRGPHRAEWCVITRR